MKFIIIIKKIKKGHFKSEDDLRNLLVRLFGLNSTFALYTGISDFDEREKRLGYELKRLREWEMPFKQVDSDMCELILCDSPDCLSSVLCTC